MAGDPTRTFMSCIEMRSSNLINSFIFVDCHKQRIISVYEDTTLHQLEHALNMYLFCPFTDINIVEVQLFESLVWTFLSITLLKPESTLVL